MFVVVRLAFFHWSVVLPAATIIPMRLMVQRRKRIRSGAKISSMVFFLFFSARSFVVLHLIIPYNIMEPIGVRANRMHAQLWEASINLHRSLVSGQVTAIRLYFVYQ